MTSGKKDDRKWYLTRGYVGKSVLKPVIIASGPMIGESERVEVVWNMDASGGVDEEQSEQTRTV